MAAHDPEGALLCIHSLVVESGRRRQGLALALLAEYVRRLPSTVTSVRLLAKAGLSPLYARAGFQLLGPSGVVHGSDAWNEWELST